MKLSEFDFDLPERLIAVRPAEPRSAARLLVARGAETLDRRVTDLPTELRPGDRLILNDTRVIPARLTGYRALPGGARIEATLLNPTPEGTWRALVKPLRKWREGEVVGFGAGLEATMTGRDAEAAILRFNLDGDAFDAALAEAGAMPLPPYIEAKRKPDARDLTDYQTVWAKRDGAVAAPTASLHFDEALLAALADRGVAFSHVTLHVGAGTFLPVKVDDIADHRMHAEWGEIGEAAAIDINTTRAAGGRIIPVGTTALRLIESAADEDGTLSPWTGETDIFITPGYRFRITDALMTNFHLPKSTLMMLVAALMGRDRIMEIYAHAIRSEYRFFSYGDASLLIPAD